MAIKWQIDPAHSEVMFKVKHLMISTVTGHFIEFEGSIETYDEDFKRGKSVDFSAATESIFTNHPQRDAHLRSMDFFDVSLYPRIHFKAVRFDMDQKYMIRDLTIKGTTRQITLQTELGGVARDPEGNLRASFSATGTINRKEFGLKWDDVTNVGNVVVGDQVILSLEMELVKI